jgi:electron transport complex protein RnfD
MATDMVTTPITIKGRIIFGIGCGVITMLVRMFGGLPEGVSLSILFMNMLTPSIDKFIKIKRLVLLKKKNKEIYYESEFKHCFKTNFNLFL